MSQLSTKRQVPEASRKEDRLAVCLPVDIQFPGKPGLVVSGEIRNISEGGAYVVCQVPVEVGQSLSLTFKFQQIHTFTVLVVAHPEWKDESFEEFSVVRWTDPKQTGAFGVEFNGLDAPTKGVIRSLIRYFGLLKKAGVKF
ncbi:MAG: PilZ domain-containing protein [Bdellovibrionales bacterium]|nr:PilZ domain-containing protein [Bdellovibrionales bacterium]